MVEPTAFDSVELLDLALQPLPNVLAIQLDSVRTRKCRQAEFLLGYYFDTGTPDVPPSTTRALYWYRRAAARGHVLACLNLGVIYDTGHQGRMECDYEAAVYWYFEAAKHGNAGAQFNLGRLLWAGKGLPKNLDVSLRFFKLAARKGHSMAISNVGAMLVTGSGATPDLRAARIWCLRAANENNAVGHLNLAIMLEQGLGGPVDRDRAERHFKLAEDPAMENAVTCAMIDDVRRAVHYYMFT
jgi:uncharacterized protein